MLMPLERHILPAHLLREPSSLQIFTHAVAVAFVWLPSHWSPWEIFHVHQYPQPPTCVVVISPQTSLTHSHQCLTVWNYIIHWSACVFIFLCDVDCRWVWPSQSCSVLHDQGVVQRNLSLNSREMSHAITISWLQLSQTISTHQPENLGQEGL